MRRLAVALASLAAWPSRPPRTRRTGRRLRQADRVRAGADLLGVRRHGRHFSEYTTSVAGKPVGFSGELMPVGLYARRRLLRHAGRGARRDDRAARSKLAAGSRASTRRGGSTSSRTARRAGRPLGARAGPVAEGRGRRHARHAARQRGGAGAAEEPAGRRRHGLVGDRLGRRHRRAGGVGDRDGRRAQDGLHGRWAVARRAADRRQHHRRREDPLLARRGPLDRVEPGAARRRARRGGADLRRGLLRGRLRPAGDPARAVRADAGDPRPRLRRVADRLHDVLRHGQHVAGGAVQPVALAAAGAGRGRQVAAADASDACAKSSGPNGHLLYDIAGVENIHGKSWAWLQRIAPGRAYEFGWDFRKGPDQTLARLDKFIDEVRAKHGVPARRAGRALLRRHPLALVHRSSRRGRARSRAWRTSARRGGARRRRGSRWPTATRRPRARRSTTVASREVFGTFTRNLTGLYYLIPPQAWFDRAPASVRDWLEVDDKPVKSSREVVDAVRAFGGNGAIAASTAANHANHIDGFSRANGVDWRIFIGSGLPTLGHIRAYSGTDKVQYSWINGDGTVPLISQRQSPTAGSAQMGDKTPTYNFCGIGHMGEMEDAPVQNAAAPFIAHRRRPDRRRQRAQGLPVPAERVGVLGHRQGGRALDRDLAARRPPAPASVGPRARAAQAPPGAHVARRRREGGPGRGHVRLRADRVRHQRAGRGARRGRGHDAGHADHRRGQARRGASSTTGRST